MIESQLSDRERFIDLFSGSGAVAAFVAERSRVPVTSVDVQEYGRVLSGAVIDRDHRLDAPLLIDSWVEQARVAFEARSDIELTASGKAPEWPSRVDVVAARERCSSVDSGFICRDYGGHYFSPAQALALDELYGSLPVELPARTVCLAALLRAASKCAAAPGHTAQPFQPTTRLLPYIRSAWSKDVFAQVRNEVAALAPRCAMVAGAAVKGSAHDYAEKVSASDVVFCDPPYSAAQYSRFYHVLEGIARGGWSEVGGAGRAPQRSVRASSDFSLKGAAAGAMASLLRTLRSRGCRVIVTFPDADASNGLSAGRIAEMALSDWTVETHYLEATHSTLGGQAEGGSRGSRRSVKEAVLILNPAGRRTS